jgi:hypothetical protein
MRDDVIKRGTGCDFAHKNGCAGDSRGKRAETHETIQNRARSYPESISLWQLNGNHCGFAV